MGRVVVVCLALGLMGTVLPGPDGAVVVPRWQVAGEGRGQPAVYGPLVYFLTRRHDVVAVDVQSGVVRWRRSTGEPGSETLGSAMVVSGGVAMAGDYAIVAFDASNGARRWRFDPADGYGVGLYLGEARNGLAFAGSPSGRIYGVRISDGGTGWSTPPLAPAPTTVFQPVVAGDAVVAGYTTFGAPVSGGLVLVDAQSGRERWRREFPRRSDDAPTGFGGGPVVSGDLVIAASGDGRIYGFDRVHGAQRWVLPALIRSDGRTADRDWRALAVSGTSLLAGSVTGVLTMFDVVKGEERWRYAHPDGGSIALRIVADDRSVYVPHLGGILVALGLRDGRKRWELGGFGDGFSWPPAIAQGSVYVAASRAGLFGLSR